MHFIIYNFIDFAKITCVANSSNLIVNHLKAIFFEKIMKGVQYHYLLCMCFWQVGLWIDAGSRYETEENNGVAHFLEHMIFKV